MSLAIYDVAGRNVRFLLTTHTKAGPVPTLIGKRVSEASRSPRAVLLITAIEIEHAIHALAEEEGVPAEERYYSPKRMLQVLVSRGALPTELGPLFSEFWETRNRVVHGRHEPPAKQLYELVDIGLRVLKLINSRLSHEYIQCVKCGSQAKVVAATSHWVEAECPRCGRVAIE